MERKLLTTLLVAGAMATALVTGCRPASPPPAPPATTGGGALAAPVQLSPADGTTLTNYPRDTTLTWQSVPSAAQYTVEIQCDTCSATPWTTWKTDTTASTSYSFTWVGDNTGQWRVAALSSGGVAGPWSGWWKFSYKTGLPAPVQLSPPNGSAHYNYPRNLTLTWQPVAGAASYQVEILCDTCQSTPWTLWKSAAVTTTSYSFTWVGDNVGRWRVTALTGGGTAGTPSGYWEFVFHTGPLPAPVQLSPANGSTFSHFPRATTLTWQAVPGAVKYRVEVQCDVCGTTPWKPWIDTTVTTTSHSFNWVGAQTGRWRVTAISPSNTPGTPSGFWQFRYTV